MVDQNLYRQIHYLKDLVELTHLHVPSIKLRGDIIRGLNYHAVIHLTDNPGLYRKEPVSITASSHQPPDHEDVEEHVLTLISDINKIWTTHTMIEIAAYALWRLCWIHPFEEGNGRTARALAYYIICRKSGYWLPGNKILPFALKENHSRTYYEALSHADKSNLNTPEASKTLSVLIEAALITQLESA